MGRAEAVDNPTGDRRVRRTRALLRQALIDLIEERGYDRTTVQDILDRADVGRSTFYTHYPTKDQLLLSGLDELRQDLERARDSSDREDRPALIAPLRPVFDHVQGHGREFGTKLGDRATALTHRAGCRMFAEILATHLRDLVTVDDEDEFDLMVTFLVDGLIGVVTRWLDAHPHLSAEQVYDLYERIATRGLEPVLADVR